MNLPTIIPLVFALGALGLILYLRAQRIVISYGEKGKYVTALPEDGTFLVIWRGNQIVLILYNPGPGWGVYIKQKTRTHVVLTPEMIDALKNSADPDLKKIGEDVYARFVARGENFDFGVEWNTAQQFFKDFTNVYFMGTEEFNVEKFQITVEKHMPPIMNKDTQTEQIAETQEETIPADGTSPFVRILFDHQMISPGRQLAGLGYELDGDRVDKDKYSVPGAFSATYAANLIIFTIKPLAFIALAKQNTIDVADKVNSLLDTRFLLYSQRKSYKEIVEENKEEASKSLTSGSTTPNGLYENLFNVNGFTLADDSSLRQLLELDTARANGEKLPDTTGLALFKYDVLGLYLDQTEILKFLRLEQEYIVTNKANETNEKGKLKVAQAHEPVAIQDSFNNFKENEWEPALQELFVDSLKNAPDKVLEVMKNYNLPGGLLAYGDGTSNSGGVIAIPADSKSKNPLTDERSNKYDKGNFSRRSDWKGGKRKKGKQNSSQNPKTN